MGLINIPSQPLRFMPYDEAQVCRKADPYCFKAQPSDPIMPQWRQTGCGIELMCDPFFNDIGPELTTNGSFIGDASGWTLSNMAYGDNDIAVVDPLFPSFATQDISLINGTTYLISVTVTAMTQGALRVVFQGGDSTPNITEAGFYQMLLQYTGVTGVMSVELLGTLDLGVDFDGTIADISVKEFSPCWVFDNNNFLIDGDSGVCHIPGVATIINQTIAPLTAPNYYRVQVVIENRTEGSATITLGVSGPNSEAVISSNGINVSYLYADTNGDFTLTLSSDFDGCIKSVSVFELKSDYSITIRDANGDPVLTNIDTFLFYKNDFITLSLSGLNALEITGGGTVSYGCYTLEITDTCDSTLYTSNCISYQETFPNTNLVVGNYFSQVGQKYGYGFQFNPFMLSQRLEFYFRNPKYPSTFENNFYSTGRLYKSYSTSEKVMEMVFTPISEIEHDALRLQINCPQFYVQKSNGFQVYYNNRTEEYSPKWDTKGQDPLAEVMIEVQAITDVLKMSNL